MSSRLMVTWEIIENRVTQRPLADGSKTLHRLLPDLIPPIGAVGYKTVPHPTMPVAGPDCRRPRVPGPGHRDVEQPPFVGIRALIPGRAEQVPRDQTVPGLPGPGRGEAVPGQRRHEHGGPLEPLGLVDGGQVSRNWSRSR